MRTCVATKVKTQPDFIMDICPERMLPQLKYRCVECDKKFSHQRLPRLCDYTGRILGDFQSSLNAEAQKILSVKTKER